MPKSNKWILGMGKGVTFPLFKSKLQEFQPNRENAYCTQEFSNRKV